MDYFMASVANMEDKKFMKELQLKMKQKISLFIYVTKASDKYKLLRL